MAEHTTLAGVGWLVDAAVCVECVFCGREDGVEF
jgi:hypothetical protein